MKRGLGNLRSPALRRCDAECAIGGAFRVLRGSDLKSEVLRLRHRDYARARCEREREGRLDGVCAAISGSSGGNSGDLAGKTLQRIDDGCLDGRRWQRQGSVTGLRKREDVVLLRIVAMPERSREFSFGGNANG